MTLDQSNVPAGWDDLQSFNAERIDAFSTAQQSFTVGLSGRLDHIDIGVMGQVATFFQIPQSAPVILELSLNAQPVAGEQLDGFHQWLPSFDLAGMPTFDLSDANIQVDVGDVLLLTVRQSSATGEDSFLAYGDAYAGGVGMTRLAGGPLKDTGGDFAFRSWVDVPDVVGVPEPATWAMLLMGFGGAGALLRRRRERLAAA